MERDKIINDLLESQSEIIKKNEIKFDTILYLLLQTKEKNHILSSNIDSELPNDKDKNKKIEYCKKVCKSFILDISSIYIILDNLLNKGE